MNKSAFLFLLWLMAGLTSHIHTHAQVQICTAQYVPVCGQVPGEHYTLRVRKDKADGPPAGAPGTIDTLLSVLRESK